MPVRHIAICVLLAAACLGAATSAQAAAASRTQIAMWRTGMTIPPRLPPAFRQPYAAASAPSAPKGMLLATPRATPGHPTGRRC